ncbi:Fructosamine kinase [Corynebacterium felinum]|uniref:Fructosamine-3-kinase n=2 Tax=Corynebacterium felinum TaxID=131318 RepID=A0ABU2B508_9CORY|nr:fructosamine-3-kinase [Corynebacterium felinum]WJY95871.1 Fructosamine kinase [Corynebacterium felinum]
MIANTYTKTVSMLLRGPKGATRAEAAGLAWLAEASTQVVKVIDVNDEQIVTEKLIHTPPNPQDAFHGGQALAHIHNAGAQAFGSPPRGWEGGIFIGIQRQPCEPETQWAKFYTQQRVRPFLHRAQLVGNLDAAGAEIVEAALVRIEEENINAGEPVSRIHGDLWGGNVLFTTRGVVFIDPAAHGGHKLTDLAMLELFGFPYLDQFIDGYSSINPLPQGWEQQLCIHQLHPLAVHAFTHGPEYAAALVERAQRTLALLS